MRLHSQMGIQESNTNSSKWNFFLFFSFFFFLHSQKDSLTFQIVCNKSICFLTKIMHFPNLICILHTLIRARKPLKYCIWIWKKKRQLLWWLFVIKIETFIENFTVILLWERILLKNPIDIPRKLSSDFNIKGKRNLV